MFPLFQSHWSLLLNDQNLPSYQNAYDDLYSSNGSNRSNGQPAVKRDKIWKIIFDVLGLVTMFALVFVFYKVLEPPTQYFLINDPEISYPYKEPHVPSIMVALLSFLFPVSIIIISNILFWFNKWDLYSGIMGSLFAYALTLVITSFFWSIVGGIRPHFLELCNVDYSMVTSLSTYYTVDICKNRARFNQDTFHGFPSGHVSTAFAGCIFVSSYLASHMRLYRNGNLSKAFIAIIPIIFAIWLGFSRLGDHHHTFLQIVFGMIIGILSGLFSYRLFYLSGFWFGHGKYSHVPSMIYN